MFELYILLGLMLGGAILAIEIRSLLSAAVAAGLVGFCLCIIFLLLRAPDVAITQLIVEVVVLVILIRATGVQQDDTERTSSLHEVFAYSTIAIFIVVFGLFSLHALQGLPAFGNPLMTVSKNYLEQGLAKTGVPNLVAAVMLDFRAFDALGTLAVLFAAALGVLSILRKTGRKKVNERDDLDS